ncbi:MAG: Unknown protein [uncultured Thiotrichaceae bacterium]|uniref:PIN domain-containing protein n=1 Tax=uncultured Thiotrichaceae bacterium TaxID=298394 RepID=A0A6S6U4Q9_9GAMM|nr:MAG: Unknown protein [uncultured Thiotrichaceae bacterium]
MVVTIDTNILIAALLSKNGASHQILRLIIAEKLKLALSTNVLLEYDDVTKRDEILKKSKFNREQVEDVLDLLALLAHKHEIYFRLRPNLTDEKDNLFVECAFASNSEYLVTSNIRDFKKGELKGFGFTVVTPKKFYQTWRKNNE